MLTVDQITQLSQKVWFSAAIRAELARLAGEEDLTAEVLVRAVKTRWNTMKQVLERALALKDILLELCDKHQFNGPKSARLRRFILSDEEWSLLEQLYQLLDVRARSLCVWSFF